MQAAADGKEILGGNKDLLSENCISIPEQAWKDAEVGIAMGKIVSDMAMDTADIVLINDDIKELPHLLLLARHMMVIIKCNLTFSMTLNLAAVILAAAGVLNPVIGELVHNAGSVIVMINSAFLLRWRKNFRVL